MVARQGMVWLIRLTRALLRYLCTEHSTAPPYTGKQSSDTYQESVADQRLGNVKIKSERG